jgi:hypothetical protein
MDLSLIKKIEVEIPLVQIAILVVLSSLVSLIGKVKLVLIFMYVAMIYWVFILNRMKFGYLPGGDMLHTVLFIVSSIVFVACAAWVIFIER